MKIFYQMVISFLILGSILFTASCSANDNNLDTLETVLNNTFSGPDKKLNKLIENPEKFTAIGDKANSKDQKSPSELELYLKELYEPYFTEDMFNKFVGEYVFSYRAKAENEMEIKHININQSESDDNIYDFTADIKYQKKENDTQVYKLKGQANFSEENKIKGFEIYSDDGLAKMLFDT